MFHEPVLKKEVVDLLITNKKGFYLDGTLGGGGHAEAILESLDKRGKLIGLDLDEEALKFANKRLKKYRNQLTAKQENFRNLKKAFKELNVHKLHGILLDLGVSSHQIDTPERGFSYRFEGKLDMRMNLKQNLTGYDIVNTYPERDLSEIFKLYGEERRFRAIARAIIKERTKSDIETTTDLKRVVSAILPHQNRAKSLSRVFQSLRIAVNEELENLRQALQDGLDYLMMGSRIAIISYHSLEDRIVKEFFKQEAKGCVCPPNFPICVCGKTGRLRILTKHPIRPSDEEVSRNPRGRSARLRVAERVEERGAKSAGKVASV